VPNALVSMRSHGAGAAAHRPAQLDPPPSLNPVPVSRKKKHAPLLNSAV